MSDPGIVGWGIVGKGLKMGSPGKGGWEYYSRKIVCQLICFYTSFNIYYVVKFISLLVAFKLFLEIKYAHSKIFGL